MIMFIWLLVFIASMFGLVKGADWLLEGAEKIGLALGLSPFVVGVVLIGFGTSLPELVSSLAAVGKGVTEVVVANAVGSNIANILLVVGVISLVDRKLFIKKNLIDLDLPLLAASTAVFLGVALDKSISWGEAVILLIGAVIYTTYSLTTKEQSTPEEEVEEAFLTRVMKKKAFAWFRKDKFNKPGYEAKDVIFMVLGVAALSVGAHYAIESVVRLAPLIGLSVGSITLIAIAFGTSLPELFVSVSAAKKQKAELAIGNIIGSCVFNLFIVVGSSAMITPLTIDSTTFVIAFPTLVIATILFVITGISRRIYAWEGLLFLLLYLVFIGKVTGII